MLDDLKSVRSCIICGSGDHDVVFDYNMDFLINVRGHDEANLRLRGWEENTTSSIVRCRNCGCNYIRDIVRRLEQFADERSRQARSQAAIDERVARTRIHDNYKRYPAMDNQNWIVRNLVLLSAERQKRDIKFLDFGAGGGDQSNMARVCGVRDVVAYDPNFVENIQEHFDAANFPGIHCVSEREDLASLGPFDAAVFQSAIEHVADPRRELRTIFDLLSPGGLLYVNNPVMDLDREIDALRSASKIVKRDRISYYHPGHFNYMMPRHFETLLKEVGFKISSLGWYPPVPWATELVSRAMERDLKAGVRWLQNVLGLPYARHVYFVEK
jgi:2-polyprenyl-3-methyl-5-hydroxy-6-metoxy-1,4-benzoquinol methylase